MSWLRVFVPSWRFFDQLGSVSQLFYRVQSPSGEWLPWTLCLQRPRRQWCHLFLNPSGNLYLASQGLVDRLVSELRDPIEEMISYQLVLNLVRHHLPSEAQVFQFQIQVHGTEVYQAVLSPEISR